jgi:hypothetical protein
VSVVNSEDEMLLDFSLKLTTCTKVYIYFLSLFKCLSFCTWIGVKSVAETKNLIDKGNKLLEKDFDIKNIVRHIKMNSIRSSHNTRFVEYNSSRITDNTKKLSIKLLENKVMNNSESKARRKSHIDNCKKDNFKTK